MELKWFQENRRYWAKQPPSKINYLGVGDRPRYRRSWFEVLAGAISWGFKSPSPHHFLKHLAPFGHSEDEWPVLSLDLVFLVLNRSAGVERGLQVNATLVYEAAPMKPAAAIFSTSAPLGQGIFGQRALWEGPGSESRRVSIALGTHTPRPEFLWRITSRPTALGALRRVISGTIGLSGHVM